MFLLYNFLLTVFSPIWVPWMIFRARRRKEQPNWTERTGSYSIPPGKGVRRIWVHAVSVGEVVASVPILRELREVLPGWEIVVSTTTSSGHRTATEQDAGLYDHLVYFPIDVPRFQLAAMQRVRPSVVAIMETELWMNFLWAAKAVDARTLLVNGRISDRAFPRSRKLRFFYRALLTYLDRALMQSSIDADRLSELGAQRTEVFGNCKFDEAILSVRAEPKLWRKELGLRSDVVTIVVGSTRGDEEERLVFEALSTLDLEEIQVIFAPRHLERVEAVAERMMRLAGRVAYRSRGETGPWTVLDTYGELAEIYSVADLVIVGGGFLNLGGQNILQPLAHGKPVIHGPHFQNFRDIARLARQAGATRVVATSFELGAAIDSLIADPRERDRMGHAAHELILSHAGAARRYAQAIALEARATPRARNTV